MFNYPNVENKIHNKNKEDKIFNDNKIEINYKDGNIVNEQHENESINYGTNTSSPRTSEYRRVPSPK